MLTVLFVKEGKCAGERRAKRGKVPSDFWDNGKFFVAAVLRYICERKSWLCVSPGKSWRKARVRNFDFQTTRVSENI